MKFLVNHEPRQFSSYPVRNLPGGHDSRKFGVIGYSVEKFKSVAEELSENCDFKNTNLFNFIIEIFKNNDFKIFKTVRIKYFWKKRNVYRLLH